MTSQTEPPPKETEKEGDVQEIQPATDSTNGSKNPKTARKHEAGPFQIDLADAFTADPGTEDMYRADNNKFAFSPGHLSKLLNPKSLNAFYALGGLEGLEKGLATNVKSGLSPDEVTVPDSIPKFEQCVPQGVVKYGHNGDTPPKPTTRAEEEEEDEEEDEDEEEAGAEGDEKDKKKKQKKQKKKKKNKKVDATVAPPMQVAQDEPFADRKKVFRDNRLPEKKTKTIFELAWIAYNDKVLLLLTAAAIVSLALGLYQTFAPKDPDEDASEENEPKVEWVEGVAIMVAIIVVVFVSTMNDWQMERQFNRLNKKNSDRTVKVVRNGKSLEISVWDLMVGDVMHLETGDVIPVDGIFIDGHGVKCDESSATGESDLLKKVSAQTVFEAVQRFKKGELEAKDVEKLDPFIISGSQVSEGTGTFLVTAVGANSTYGRTTMALRTEQEDTPLQKKLNRLADGIAKFGGGAALLLFVVLLIKFLVDLKGNNETPRQKGQDFMELFIVSVTVVVVAVPEGLPLAVTLALAFATTRMMKDNNLVRILKACETMGNATTICSDKTGTLTQNKMTVVAATLGKSSCFGGTDKILEEPDDDANESHARPSTPVPNVPIAEFVNSMSDETKQLLIQSNAVNSTAFEGDQNGEKTFIGSKTEVALLTLSRDHLGAGPVQEERSNANVVQVMPFDSKVKYMATVVKLPNGKFRAYLKGASEILLAKCTKTLADAGSADLAAAEMTEGDRALFQETITSYAGQTLRTIGSSFRDFDSWPPQGHALKDHPQTADLTAIHEDMTLIAIYGIKDPLRPSVIEAIKDCQKAGVVVRMVTGDNILTGRAIARECGIYTPETGGIAMEGQVFRRLPEAELKQILPNLQVLARSSPEDKRILVRTLKEMNETVAVTGDGTNDAPALKMADIGFSMGIAGTEVAKEASAIILMDDNFSSIVKGMMWGRAVNDSVKKFLQFQLTVNVTAVVVTFVTSVASEKRESVLTAVQLLWVNLIMDTFAALALATDPPTRSVLDRKPEGKRAPLITLRMAKMILGQAICQLAITLCLHFGAETLLKYDLSSDDTNDSEHMHHKTLVFNTFVWLQIFNEVNNRRLDNKLNIFEGIQHNYFFIIMNLIMVGGQVLIIFVGGPAFKVTPLNGKEWGMSIGLGAISIPWGALIRLFPDEWIAKALPWFIRKRWAPESITPDVKQEHDEEDFGPPLRTLSMIRGKRPTNHIGFRDRMHDARERARNKIHTSGSKEMLNSNRSQSFNAKMNGNGKKKESV